MVWRSFSLVVESPLQLSTFGSLATETSLYLSLSGEQGGIRTSQVKPTGLSRVLVRCLMSWFIIATHTTENRTMCQGSSFKKKKKNYKSVVASNCYLLNLPCTLTSTIFHWYCENHKKAQLKRDCWSVRRVGEGWKVLTVVSTER